MSRTQAEKKEATENPRSVFHFTSVTNHCTSVDRQVTMRMLAAASSARRLADELYVDAHLTKLMNRSMSRQCLKDVEQMFLKVQQYTTLRKQQTAGDAASSREQQAAGNTTGNSSSN